MSCPINSEVHANVHCPPLSRPAVNFNRDSLPTSFATSAVENHVNIGVTGETLLHRLVHPLGTARNDEEMPLVHIPISTLSRVPQS